MKNSSLIKKRGKESETIEGLNFNPISILSFPSLMANNKLLQQMESSTYIVLLDDYVRVVVVNALEFVVAVVIRKAWNRKIYFASPLSTYISSAKIQNAVTNQKCKIEFFH